MSAFEHTAEKKLAVLWVLQFLYQRILYTLYKYCIELRESEMEERLQNDLVCLC